MVVMDPIRTWSGMCWNYKAGLWPERGKWLCHINCCDCVKAVSSVIVSVLMWFVGWLRSCGHLPEKRCVPPSQALDSIAIAFCAASSSACFSLCKCGCSLVGNAEKAKQQVGDNRGGRATWWATSCSPKILIEMTQLHLGHITALSSGFNCSLALTRLGIDICVVID